MIMRILLTRPESESKQLAARLGLRGHDGVTSPVLTIAARDSLPSAAGYDGLLATSANAFLFLPDDALVDEWSNAALYCVGARTEKAALARGFPQPAIVTADSAALAAAMRERLQRKGHLLYLTARDRKRDLEAGLEAAGIQVSVQIVYEAIAATTLSAEASSALAAGQIDAVLHFSSRSAAIFVRLATMAGLADHAKAIRHVCISSNAAAALDQLQPQNVEIASQPDTQGVLQCL